MPITREANVLLGDCTAASAGRIRHAILDRALHRLDERVDFLQR